MVAVHPASRPAPGDESPPALVDALTKEAGVTRIEWRDLA